MRIGVLVLLIHLSSCTLTSEYRKNSDMTLVTTAGVVGGSFFELGRIHNENFEYGIEGFTSYIDSSTQNGVYARWYPGNSFFLKLGVVGGSNLDKHYLKEDNSYQTYTTRTTYYGPSLSFGHRWIYLKYLVLAFDYINFGAGVIQNYETTLKGEKVETPKEYEIDGAGGSLLLLGLGIII